MNRRDTDPFSSAPCIDDLDFILGNGTKVKLTNENIEDIKADAVIVGNDESLSNSGNASKSLLEKGGVAYASSVKNLMKTPRNKEMTVLRCDASPQLKCKKVYHAVVPGLFSSGKFPSSQWRQQMEGLYTRASAMAVEDKATTVAVVLIGAGKAGGPTEDSVRAALAAFSSLPASSSLSRLLLVERDERKTRDAILECQKWTTEHHPPQQP